ncbi:MAG: phosphopantetheine-binding protein [Acutalibacteraceae bacterium]|nr:phosphopantetheine-binding protein [Acutalibacteraceae bacterium]
MSKQNNEILERLAKLFESVFENEVDISSLSTESRLIEDLGMNSIGLLYMAMAVEEEFGVRFTNDDFSTLKTVGDVINKIGA